MWTRWTTILTDCSLTVVKIHRAVMIWYHNLICVSIIKNTVCTFVASLDLRSGRSVKCTDLTWKPQARGNTKLLVSVGLQKKLQLTSVNLVVLKPTGNLIGRSRQPRCIVLETSISQTKLAFQPKNEFFKKNCLL